MSSSDSRANVVVPLRALPLAQDNTPQTLPALEAQAIEAAALLRLLANDRRLLLLCHMLGDGEVTVGTLANRVGLSQSATSQHLKKLRVDRLVATRRQGTIIHYRIADPRVESLIGVLHDMFCPTA